MKKESMLERDFWDVKRTVSANIEKHLIDAQKSIAAAVKLAEKHGIPFETDLSPMNQVYFPHSFNDKWGELSESLRKDQDLIDIKNGWQASKLC